MIDAKAQLQTDFAGAPLPVRRFRLQINKLRNLRPVRVRLFLPNIYRLFLLLLPNQNAHVIVRLLRLSIIDQHLFIRLVQPHVAILLPITRQHLAVHPTRKRSPFRRRPDQTDNPALSLDRVALRERLHR